MTRTEYCTRLRAAGLTVKPARQATSHLSDTIDVTLYQVFDTAGVFVTDLILWDDGPDLRVFTAAAADPADLVEQLIVDRFFRTTAEAGA
jgi:hypothetical protein